MRNVYIGLLHYPVYNRHGEIITTSITNLDLHDIARLAATYDLAGYYVIQPDKSQQDLAQSIMAFWRTDLGKSYNADRYQAFERLKLIDTLAEALAQIKQGGQKVYVVVTDAKPQEKMIAYAQMRQMLQKETDAAFLLLFGTGWGISQDIIAQADYCLPPIKGAGAYNHLSVRSAAAIIVDRLLGE